MKIAIETITPEIAQQMLTLNTRNRRLNPKHVQFLRREIEEGRWELNGATIVFDGNTLMDGQHRLEAVVQAQIPIPMLVVRGAKPDAFSTIDSGRKRGAADVLYIEGEINTTHLASALRLLWHYQRRLLSLTQPATWAVSGTTIQELLHAHPGIRRSVQVGLSIKKLCPPSVAATAHYLLAEDGGAELADLFFLELSQGLNLAANSPVYYLREALLKNQASKHRVHAAYLLGLILKTWRLYKDSIPATNRSLTFILSGSRPERFPYL